MSLDTMARVEHTELSPLIGSRIHLDKAALLSGEFAAELRDLLEERGVLVFPQIHFSDEEQAAFTRTMGKFLPELEGQEVYKISLDDSVNARSEYLKGSLYWHIDGTMNKVPIGAAVLSSKVLPTWGGNTEFCNTYAAWNALPEDDKALIADLRAMHAAWTTLLYYEPETSYAKLDRMIGLGETELPLVWRHRSGRNSLVLGATAHHVLGMDPTASTRLLVRLREWATQPRFVYSHAWSEGDAVMWDNTGTMHRAMPYDPDCGRLLHRTKTEGEEPIA